MHRRWYLTRVWHFRVDGNEFPPNKSKMLSRIRLNDEWVDNMDCVPEVICFAALSSFSEGKQQSPDTVPGWNTANLTSNGKQRPWSRRVHNRKGGHNEECFCLNVTFLVLRQKRTNCSFTICIMVYERQTDEAIRRRRAGNELSMVEDLKLSR